MPTQTEAIIQQHLAQPNMTWLKRALQDSDVTFGEIVLPLNTLNPFRIDEADGGYQRPISESRVQDLFERFDPSEAREIFVSERADGTRWILDGQHTWATLVKKGYTHWMCRVFIGLTIPEEAKRFAEYQNNSRRIPPVVQFNAERVGGDPTAIALDDILGSFYLRISSSKLRKKSGYRGVTSRGVFQKLYELGGQQLLSESLQVVIDAWGHNKESFKERVLQGLGYLFSYADTPFDRKRFLAVLKNNTPKTIMEAIGPTGPGGAARSGALQILSLYLEGFGPEYPTIRKNAKEAPKLPEGAAPKEGPQVKESYWTSETEDFGRVAVAPVVEEPKAPKAPRTPKAKKGEQSTDGVASVVEGEPASGESEASVEAGVVELEPEDVGVESEPVDVGETDDPTEGGDQTVEVSAATEEEEDWGDSDEVLATQSGTETSSEGLSGESDWEYPGAAGEG